MTSRDRNAVAESTAKYRAKAPSPWSVRGVAREARSKVAKAAARRRETIGEWVTNALNRAANEELGIGPRLEQLEKRNDAIAALTLLAERLESAEQREKSLLAMMQSVTERADRGEERISDITRGLTDIAIKLEAVLDSNRMHAARNISDSAVPQGSVAARDQDKIFATPKHAIKPKKR